MNRVSLGSLAIMLGCLVLSMELFGLKIIQGLDKVKEALYARFGDSSAVDW